ncbi:MAG: hypothetical protein J6Y37_04750 [Paludibacteraceae bacterium]|nr:hypothetical protein [Paludibacteraceae bacterium]
MRIDHLFDLFDVGICKISYMIGVIVFIKSKMGDLSVAYLLYFRSEFP